MDGIQTQSVSTSRMPLPQVHPHTSEPMLPVQADTTTLSTAALQEMYGQHQASLEEWGDYTQGMNAQQRQKALQQLAQHAHSPMDMHLAQQESTYALSHGDKNRAQTFVDMRRTMNEAHKRAGERDDETALPRLMVQDHDRNAFDELGREVRDNMGPNADPDQVAHRIGHDIEALDLQAGHDSESNDRVDAARHGHPVYYPQQALVDSRTGRCGEFSNSLKTAMQAAGLNTRQQVASWVSVPGLDGLDNHGVAAYQGKDGGWRVLDPWQYGQSHNGSLQGFGQSRFNGMPEATWWQGQADDGKSYHSIEASY